MKVLNVCLAAAGACLVATAAAQSANPVTLYGRIYTTVESVEAKEGTTPVVQRVRMRDQSSYLGVRGEEDLGGGLKAFFQLETGFNPEQPSGTFANRNTGVGLRGTWGSVLIGRWDTPFKQSMVGSVDSPFRCYLPPVYFLQAITSLIMIPVLSHLFTDRRIQDFPELIHRRETDSSLFPGFLDQPHQSPWLVLFKTIETNNEIFHIQKIPDSFMFS